MHFTDFQNLKEKSSVTLEIQFMKNKKKHNISLLLDNKAIINR